MILHSGESQCWELATTKRPTISYWVGAFSHAMSVHLKAEFNYMGNITQSVIAT